VGLDVLKPVFGWHVPYIDDAERRKILDAYKARLATVFTETPLDLYPSLSDFDSVMRPLAGASTTR